MIAASYQTNACFEAWMKCESLLVNMARFKNSVSKNLSKLVDECAVICMGTFHALKSRSASAVQFAVLCMGICEECAAACDELNDENFRQCALACRQCSDSMSNLAFASLN
jgi:hypothetical protein